jgi:hypothetical protein
MSLYLDKKYINLVSSSLEKFKWKKGNLANCRCPICGDSELNKNKARGYFFSSDNTYFFKCHNCGASYNIYKFLEIMSPPLFQQYCLEQFKDKNPQEEVIPKTNNSFSFSADPPYDKIEDLPENHEARIFLEKRKIPYENRKIGYTELFGQYAKQLNSDYNLLNDKRIIIPIYDEHNKLIGVQGRSPGNVKPKYITLKRNENIKLTYGFDKLNKSKGIFVVEGPIDSMFLPNAIATLGVGNFLEVREKLQNQDLVFVLDNEPRNKNVVDVGKQLIEKNEKICIFPKTIKDKDINDMVLNGLDVVDIITSNTFSGAAAMLAFNSWRKC